ncbi:hypothetical protein BY996DRAFT_6565712 [Phakopsora pachyrhizi]|nr:hypothetical protein BY996DRAFT_6565712 [Phakopsora pachyrhizi]
MPARCPKNLQGASPPRSCLHNTQKTNSEPGHREIARKMPKKPTQSQATKKLPAQCQKNQEGANSKLPTKSQAKVKPHTKLPSMSLAKGKSQVETRMGILMKRKKKVDWEREFLKGEGDIDGNSFPLPFVFGGKWHF